jgi:hypothetical protein
MIRVLEACAVDVQKQADNHKDEISQGLYAALLLDIQMRLRSLRSDVEKTLTAGRLELAQSSVDVQGQTLEANSIEVPMNYLADSETSFDLSTGDTLTVRFGSVAMRAVNETAKRVYSHGYTLAGVLENLDRFTMEQVADLITQGVAQGMSATRLADGLHALFTEAGADTPYYRAMRIARTEINTSYQEAHLQSVIDPMTGTLYDFAEGLRWNLSLSHPRPDICDVWAGHDSGIGEGVYEPDDVPQRHPNCLCYLTTVLKSFPEVSAPNKTPDTAGVPDSQVAYWAENGDIPAQALLANRQATTEGLQI